MFVCVTAYMPSLHFRNDTHLLKLENRIIKNESNSDFMFIGNYSCHKEMKLRKSK